MLYHLEVLNPPFQEKVETLLLTCLEKGVVMAPYESLRDPFEQARNWCRSRSEAEIQQQIDFLKKEGADFLAYCIEMAGPQTGVHTTNSLPGYSWHQWGEAIDCVWWVNNDAVWDCQQLIDGINGYQVYAALARQLGLDCGLYRNNFVEAPHVQWRAAAGPSSFFTVQEINDQMRMWFADRTPGQG